MKPQLAIESVWHDNDVLQIWVRASNGRYAGTSLIYTDADGSKLIDLGNRLHGFPKHIDQHEEQELGFTRADQQKSIEERKVDPATKQPLAAYVYLKFLCVDQMGHTALDITIQEDPWNERAEAKGKASFEIRFEAAQIDTFANALISLGRSNEGSAVLLGIYDGRDRYPED